MCPMMAHIPKLHFVYIYKRYPYVDITVLDMNILCLIPTLVVFNEFYVMIFSYLLELIYLNLGVGVADVVKAPAIVV